MINIYSQVVHSIGQRYSHFFSMDLLIRMMKVFTKSGKKSAMIHIHDYSIVTAMVCSYIDNINCGLQPSQEINTFLWQIIVYNETPILVQIVLSFAKQKCNKLCIAIL